MPSNQFFLLSPHSRLGLFHPYAVVWLALGVSSNSKDFGQIRSIALHSLRMQEAVNMTVSHLKTAYKGINFPRSCSYNHYISLPLKIQAQKKSLLKSSICAGYLVTCPGYSNLHRHFFFAVSTDIMVTTPLVVVSASTLTLSASIAYLPPTAGTLVVAEA